MNYPKLERLIEIIATLRGENGCQWDREQTHKSLRPNMLEEAYEAVDAIEDNDMVHLKEELGDKYDEYMYEINLSLLKKIEKVRDFVEKENTARKVKSFLIISAAFKAI